MVPAADVVAALLDAGQTVATAESLTGGLVVAGLTAVPGSSSVVRGGVCAYSSEVKARVVGVSQSALAAGAVNAEVAGELAVGAVRLFGAQWGVGTTGAAGPDPSEDAQVGTVFVAVHGPQGEVGCQTVVERLSLTGDRGAIRFATVEAAFRLLRQRL
nr:nicotinamide-nucleotide amidohydrolase family protein [Dermatophilus congolensis]